MSNYNFRDYSVNYPNKYNNRLPENKQYAFITQIKDYGKQPIVFNMEAITKKNNNYRSTLWTGSHIQLTLMSIRVGGDIGLEVHPDVDQFIRIEEGTGTVLMGPSMNNMNIEEKLNPDFALIVPSGTWHNVINTGNIPLKLYSIYGPPNHPHGTVQKTKEEAME